MTSEEGERFPVDREKRLKLVKHVELRYVYALPRLIALLPPVSSRSTVRYLCCTGSADLKPPVEEVQGRIDTTFSLVASA